MKARNKFFIALFFLLAVVAVFYFIFNKKPAIEYTLAKVSRGRLIQTVSETGMVKSTKEIELNFQNVGQITNIYVAVGDQVKKYQIMAELDNTKSALKAREAQANLRVAQANLAKLLSGATKEEINVSQAGADQASTTYNSALNELEKVQHAADENIKQAEKGLSDLYLTSGQTITSHQLDIKNYKAVALTVMTAKIPVAIKSLDNINTILSDSDAKNYLSASKVALIDVAKTSFNEAKTAVNFAQASLSDAQADQTNEKVIKALTEAAEALNKPFKALKDCYAMLEASVVSSVFTQAELDAYKETIGTQQTNISAGLTSLQTAQSDFHNSVNDLNNKIQEANDDLNTAKVSAAQQIAAAKSKADNSSEAWQVALAELNKIKSKARDQDINLTQAQVSQAQAALDLANNQINDNVLKAPSDGTVSKSNYEAGEQTSVAQPVFLILGINNFEIEVDVSEADINKVVLDNPAEITLDAFGDEVKFNGTAYFIEPAETVIQDVIYYKVKISFDPQGQNIKSGMTANVSLTTARKDNVLIMPSRAVIEKNGSSKFARLLVDQQVREAPIKVGLNGDDGLVEVLSGLEEGDAVVTYIKQGK